MSLRLLLLSSDDASPSRCLHVDATGAILESVELTPARPLPDTFAARATRNVVVVPGTDVRALWLDLPAHTPVQALAAATLLLEDHIAGPRTTLHVAIAPRRHARRRLVAAVESGTLRDWLRRAAALGMTADAVLPDHLLLPGDDDITDERGTDKRATGHSAITARAEDDRRLVACSIDGRWIVRGPALAFSTEAALARQIVGERPYELVEDCAAVDALLAAGAISAPIDLLQYKFALRDAARSEGPGRKRLTLLVLALLLSPVLLVLAQALRYQLAARSLDRQAAAIAAPLVAADAGDPVAALRMRQRALEGPRAMHALRSSLFESVAASAGTRLDAFEYADSGTASATVVHATPEQLQDLIARLQQRGIRAQQGDSASVGDGVRTRLTLEPGP